MQFAQTSVYFLSSINACLLVVKIEIRQELDKVAFSKTHNLLHNIGTDFFFNNFSLVLQFFNWKARTEKIKY